MTKKAELLKIMFCFLLLVIGITTFLFGLPQSGHIVNTATTLLAYVLGGQTTRG
jgi:hypothetical protein